MPIVSAFGRGLYATKTLLSNPQKANLAALNWEEYSLYAINAFLDKIINEVSDK